MVRDITPTILTAFGRRIHWDPYKAESQIRQLVASGALHVSEWWDADWAWLSFGPNPSADPTTACIWWPAPLALIFPSVSDAVLGFVASWGMVVEVVEQADWRTPCFSIQPDILATRGLANVWKDEPGGVPIEGFSVGDLLSNTHD